VITESGKAVGLIDVESEKLNAFTENDRDFLEHAAYLIARALK
jgi:putative methionine-R-sulfoxide reductase with GAF domain